jgi:hypothetical protein
MNVRAAAASAIAAVVFVLPAVASAAGGSRGVRVDCSSRSQAIFPGAFRDPHNLVVGPFALVGAGEDTAESTVRRFGGQKFPVLVKAGHVVTVTVPPGIGTVVSLGYGPLPQGRYLSAADGHDTVTFAACRDDETSGSSADGPVTFWSGFVLADRPACAPLDVSVDGRPARRVWLSLGRHCAV